MSDEEYIPDRVLDAILDLILGDARLRGLESREESPADGLASNPSSNTPNR